MATCYLHKGVFANTGVCPKCKTCKHERWNKIEDNYECANCPKITKNEPDGEIWELQYNRWEKVK